MRSTKGLIWRNLTAHYLRSTLTTLAITLGVAMVLAASIVGQAANQSVAAMEGDKPRIDLEILARDGSLFDAKILDILRDHPDIELASPSLQITVESVNPPISEITLIGVTPAVYQELHQPQLAGGTFLDGDDIIVLPVPVALNHGLSVGDEMTLRAGEKTINVRVSGRLKTAVSTPNLAQVQTAVTPLPVAQILANAPGQIDRIEIVLRPGADVVQVKGDLIAQLDSNLAVVPVSGSGSSFALLFLQGGLAIVGVIILFAAAFVIMNAFAMSVTARAQEIGALRAVGMTRRQVMRQVLAEAGLLGVSGVILGIPSGIGLAWLIMILRHSLEDGRLIVPWWGVIFGVGLGLTTTLLGALQPAWRASRVSPLAAMHQQAQSGADDGNWYVRYGGRFGGIFLMLGLAGVTAVALIWQPDFIWSGALLSVSVVGLLAATLLLMPALIDPVVWLTRPFLTQWLGASGRLAADNLIRNRLRTALTAAALTIGLTTIIATSALLTASLKGGLNGFFNLFNEQGMILPDIPALLASGAVTPETSLEALSVNAPLDPELVTAVSHLDFITANPYGFARIPPELSTLPGGPGLFVEPDIFIPMGNFDFFEGNPAAAQEILNKGQAVLLIPLIAERLGVGVGDKLNVPTLKGDVEFIVAGIGGNASNFPVFAYADGQRYFGLGEPTWLGLIIPEGQDIDATLAKVEEIVAPYDDLVVFDMRDSGVGGLIDMVGQMQVMFNTLLLLAVVVAALGVVNTMVINVSERGREIGLLRAVGATRRQVRQAVMIEAAILGLLAALVATAVGLVTLALFVLIFTPGGTESVGIRTGWDTAMIALPPALRDLGLTALLSFVFGPLVAGLAAYYPARLAASVNVMEATRSERLSLTRAEDGRTESHHGKRGWGISLLLTTRNISRHRLRAAFSVFAVSLGVAMIITADYVSSALLATLQNAGEGTMQITHGFIVEQFDLTIGLVGYVLMGAAAFLIFNAFAMSITERQQQIGALRSLGMTRRQILGQVLLEALIIGGLGTVAGLLLGPIMGQGVVSFMQRFGGEFLAFGAGSVSWGTAVLATIIGLSITLLSALLPARRAAWISPLAAMRPPETGDWRLETKIFNRQSLIASLLIALLFAYLAIAPPGDWIETPWSETVAIIFVLFWLLCLGLLLPTLIRFVGAASRRLLGAKSANSHRAVTARLIGDNIQRSRGRVILTILTLAVGLGTITGLTGFMTYAFDDLMGASIRRIAANNTWAVFAFDLESGFAGLTELDDIELPAEAITAAQTAAGDRAGIIPVRFAIIPELSFFGSTYFTFVADPAVIRDNPNFFRFTEGDWETAMPIMIGGCGTLIAPLIANRQNVGVGDTLAITGPNGPMDCTIAGIGSGYVNASIVGENVGDELGATQPTGLSITPRPGVDVAALEADLQQAMAANRGAANPGIYMTRMSDFADLQAEALGLFAAALNGMLLLAVVAAALGVINTTVMSIHERRQELGLLRAVGATRRQVRQVVMGENALIGLVGAIFGVVAGMGSVVIIVTTLGGSAYGVTDLDLWPAAGRALKPTIVNGIVGILAAPLISAWASRWPIRSLLRGSAIATLNPEQQPEMAEREPHREPARHLYSLAWRNLQEQRLRTLFSATAVALGVAMIIAAKVTSTGILNTTDGENAFAVFIDIMGTMLSVIGIAIMAAAGFLIFNAFAMTVAQRKRQIGVLRSLGMTRGQVMRQLLAEALFTGVIGVALGLFLGPLFGNGILAIFRQLGTGVGQGRATPGSILLASVMGLGITLLSVLIPARQATQVSPLAALKNQETRDRRSETKSSIITLQSLVSSLILITLWLYLAIAPPGAWTGLHSPWEYLMPLFLFLPWLLGLTLLLPTLIELAGRGARRLAKRRGANLRLITDNLTRERRRVTLTVLTFAVGLGMISFNNGILSFTNDVLLSRATEDMRQQTSWTIFPYDRSSGVAQITEMNRDNGINTAVYDEVYRLAEGRAHVSDGYMVTVPEISSPMPGFPSFISTNLDSQASGPGQFRFVEGDWETARPIMESGCGLLLPPTVAARNGVGLGDTLTLPVETGPINCTVAGIGAGGSVPASLISAAALGAFDVGAPSYLTVWPMAGADAAALDADLRAMADRFGEDAFISTPEGELRAVTDTSDQLESMSYAMLALAVVAAALGMVNTTVMSVTERRHELGLLRSVGMTRRQATTVVVGEAALIGLLGGLLGLVAGLGLTLIFGLSYGGIPFGLVDLPLWEAAWEAAPAAILAGLAGVVIAPIVGGLAAYWPSRSVLRGTAVETLDTSYRPDVRQAAAGLFSRGSIRTRFVLGTAVLMLLVLVGLTATVVRHARNYLEETTADAVTALVEFNASMVEFNLPPDTETLTLDDLQSGNLDADTMLQFRSLIDEMNAFGLTEFVVADQDDIVLFGFDMGQIGEVLEPLADRERAVTAVAETESGERQITATTPIQNENGDLLGSVRLHMELGEIGDFLRDLNRAILTVGALILALALALAWWATTPLVRATRQLSAGAAQAGVGQFSKIALPKRLNVSLRWQLTAVMILILILLVGALEQVVLPIERRKVEEVTQDTLIAGAEWAAQLLSSGLADQSLNLSQFTDLSDLFRLMQRADLGQIQDLSEQVQNEAVAYTAVADEAGVIQLSNQFDLMGSEIPLPTQTVLEETEWQGAPIWRVTTPLRDEESNAISGALQMGVLTAPVEDFLTESRNLFRLTGIIGVLAGVILAGAIGGAVVAPVQKLAADTRRVGQGDLSVQFKVSSRDELAQLAGAYNEMVAGLREREWLRDMFGRFVSQEVAEAIRTGQVKLEGENRVVSVLFCDIRSFTTRSEKATPAEIVALLNEYLPVVVSAAQHHEGTVNKFGGDSTLVIYGAPKPLQESAYRAIRTALEMQHNLAALNQRLAARGEEPIRIGVGISTGMVLAGAVGPPERQEYTVIGDTVNLASRIEALNKEYPQHGILISGPTYEALDSRRAEFAFTDLGEIQIRGKANAVRVWAVKSVDFP